MKATLILFSALLVGCASLPNTYNPNKKPVSELATIKKEDTPIFSMYFASSIVSVFDQNKNEVIETGFPTTKHFQVTLKEGKYVVALRCNDTYLLGFPLVAVDLKSGERYIAYCRKVTEDGITVGISGAILHEDEQAPPGP
jgi:hypothetical protein